MRNIFYIQRDIIHFSLSCFLERVFFLCFFLVEGTNPLSSIGIVAFSATSRKGKSSFLSSRSVVFFSSFEWEVYIYLFSIFSCVGCLLVSPFIANLIYMVLISLDPIVPNGERKIGRRALYGGGYLLGVDTCFF